MNIAKQKEILSLRSEIQTLEQTFRDRHSQSLSIATTRMLESAEESILDFLQGEGFSVDNYLDDKGYYVARFSEIWVNVSPKDRILSVSMSNGEYYNVTVESTVYLEGATYGFASGGSQDSELIRLQSRIEEIEKHILALDSQEFRYCLTVESNGIQRGHNFEKFIYINFEDALNRMFS